MGLKTATAADRELLRAALHTLVCHVSAKHWEAVRAAEDHAIYCGMQLGTSSQARAHGELMDAVDAAIDEIQGRGFTGSHSVAEAAESIRRAIAPKGWETAGD